MSAIESLGRIRKWWNLRGDDKFCSICEKTFRSFLPLDGGKAKARVKAPVTQALEVIGSDRDNFWCPSCRCHDRVRHLKLYFDALGLWDLIDGGDVLHFAPEGHFARKIISRNPSRYVQADLEPDTFRNPNVVAVNVQAIEYDDQSFDLVICNHVLEHVPDPRCALREISRVLKSGKGAAVLQTPFSPLIHRSFEDPSVQAPDLRKRLFGQEDHVRVFGTELFDMIEEAGMDLDLQTHQDALVDFDPKRFGVNVREPLILGRRK